MGKFRVAKSVISKTVSASKLVNKVVKLPSINSAIGNVPGLDTSMLSNFKSDPKVSGTFDKISNAQSMIQSGPVGDVVKAMDKAQKKVGETAVAKEVNKVVESAKSKGNDFINIVKIKVTDQVAASGIKDNPEVKKVVNDLKGKLSETGVDVDAYLDACKDIQE